MKIINIEKLKELEVTCKNEGSKNTSDLVLELVRGYAYGSYEDAPSTITKDTLTHYGYVIDIELEEKKPIVSPHNFGG